MTTLAEVSGAGPVLVVQKFNQFVVIRIGILIYDFVNLQSHTSSKTLHDITWSIPRTCLSNTLNSCLLSGLVHAAQTFECLLSVRILS